MVSDYRRSTIRRERLHQRISREPRQGQAAQAAFSELHDRVDNAIGQLNPGDREGCVWSCGTNAATSKLPKRWDARPTPWRSDTAALEPGSRIYSKVCPRPQIYRRRRPGSLPYRCRSNKIPKEDPCLAL